MPSPMTLSRRRLFFSFENFLNKKSQNALKLYDLIAEENEIRTELCGVIKTGFR
jgi:hypothetical protein